MRRAIFGGTFDPIHNAHLRIACEAAERIALDEVLLIPAAMPPHKVTTRTPWHHRFRMVELAVGGEPRLVPSRLEEGQTKSYSVHTIERVKAQGGDVFFIIGADAFAELGTWHRAAEVIASVEFIVISRPGHSYQIPSGARVHRLDTLALDVSSSSIRAQLAAGKTPAELAPKVVTYILANGLYRGS
jgi:nicotinate-nucleotide adenylyltransferase